MHFKLSHLRSTTNIQCDILWIMDIIDAHAHIHSFTTRQLLNANECIQDWKIAWQRAQQAGITHIINVFDVADTNEVKLIEQMKVPGIYIAAAVHPCQVHQISLADAQQWLIQNIHQIDCIGETGIDTYNNINTLASQKEYLHMHLRIAQQYNKPVCLHLRTSDNVNTFITDIISILKSYTLTVMVHCCTFSFEQVKAFLQLKRCYISIAGIVTYKNAKDVHDLATHIPLNRMLVETDTPYLTPQVAGLDRRSNNQPAYIIKTYERIAQLKGVERNTLYTQVSANLFNYLNCQ
jgi:TatD DNase family protein